MRRLADYLADNEAYVRWWTAFVAAAEEALPRTRARWVLMGSRSFGLAYPESDIEGAVLGEVDEQDELLEQLRAYLDDRGWQASATVTSAGLTMLVLREVHRDAEVDI